MRFTEKQQRREQKGRAMRFTETMTERREQEGRAMRFTEKQWRENNKEQNIECWDWSMIENSFGIPERALWKLEVHYGELPKEIILRHNGWVAYLDQVSDTNLYLLTGHELEEQTHENWMVYRGQ